MPVPSLPVAAVAPGNVLTSTNWNAIVKDSINKLFNQGHRVLTVAQFAALTGLEGTKGTVAPDEVYLEVDSTAGIEWHLAYESGEPTYKWRFIGGPPLFSEVVAAEGVTSAAYAALTTPGPSVALPRGGDYDIELSAAISNSITGADTYMSYDIGGTGAVDADGLYSAPASGTFVAGYRKRRKTALATGTLTSKYKTSGGTSTYKNRTMSAAPVRIRHDA